MKYFLSFFIGITTGVAATLLHLFFPPVGIFLAIVGTLTAIWAVGRGFGNRRFKLIASTAWILVMYKAATLGSGQELLVQGDTLGMALIFGGLVAIIFAIALPL